MQLSKTLRLLVVGLSAVSVAEATFVNLRAAGAGNAVQRRQDDEESDAPAATTTTVPPAPATTSTRVVDPPTTTSEPPPKTTSSTSDAPPPRTSTSSSRDTPAPSTSSKPPAPTPSSTSSKPSPTSPPDETSSSDEDEKPAEPTTQTITTVITSKLADGSETTLTSEFLSTATPGFADNGGNGGKKNSGMSPQTRNTVIGVVVGVGGAIILGGLALVAWRIWGRRKNQEEHDGLMDYGSDIVGKPENAVGSSTTGRTPFQSTLESYHAPTQVNTAANF